MSEKPLSKMLENGRGFDEMWVWQKNFVRDLRIIKEHPFQKSCICHWHGMVVLLVNFEEHNLSLSVAERQVALTTNLTIESVRSDEAFDLFWEKVNDTAKSLDISGPQLPRQCKQPKRCDDGLSQVIFIKTLRITTTGTTLKQLI